MFLVCCWVLLVLFVVGSIVLCFQSLLGVSPLTESMFLVFVCVCLCV